MSDLKIGNRVMVNGDDAFDGCTGYIKKIIPMYVVEIDKERSSVLFSAEKLVPEFKVNIGGSCQWIGLKRGI